MNLPVVSTYAKTRGWPFIMAWGHRISGLGMVAYALFHIYTLSSLETPSDYDAQMEIFRGFPFFFLEWVLAIPIIFHALNGGRLIFYETFTYRNDESMIHWVLGLSSLYVLLLGALMIMGNQSVSPTFFWLTTLLASLSLGYLVASKIWKSSISMTWKVQRITGAFLLIMVTAHLLFTHLNPSVGHEANVVIGRMQNVFIKIVDLALVLGILYHAGYGLLSIAKDYLQSRFLTGGCALLIVVVMVIFAWIGVKLTLFI